MLGGTGVAQVILIAASPVITRLYSPEAFGYFEVFYSTVSILAAVVCLQYDMSIYTAADERQAINAWASTSVVIITVCLLIAAFIGLFKSVFLKITGATIREAWEWVVPLHVFFGGSFTLLMNWFTRQGDFKTISIARICLSCLVVACQIGFGFMGLGYWGLVISTVSVQGITFVVFMILFVKKYGSHLRNIDGEGMRENLVRNRNLPLLVWPGNFLNNVTQNLPAFFLGRIDATVLGYYSLSRRILGVPMSFVANSVQNIFMKEASDEYASTGKASTTYKKNLILLSAFGVIITALIIGLGSWIIPLAFGEQWVGSVEYIYILCVLYVIRFISGSLSFVMVLGKGPKVDIFWQVALFTLTYSVFSLIPADTRPLTIILVYCFATSLYYLLYMLQSYSLSKNPDLERGLFKKF